MRIHRPSTRAGVSARPIARSIVPALAIAIAAACGDSTTGVGRPPGDSVTVVVAGDSVVLTPGSSRQLAVTIGVLREEVHLEAEGAPAGVRASFSPLVLHPGDTQAVVTIMAVVGAPPASATLTIRVVASDAAESAVPLATGSLGVRVAAPTCPDSPCAGHPVGEGGVVEGVVREWTGTGMRPAAGVSVFAWVQTQTTGWVVGHVTTDADGAYRFAELPAAYVLLQAVAMGFDQPCGAFLAFTGPHAIADLVVARKTVGVPIPDPAAPALVGTAYEKRGGERIPLAGVLVYLEWGSGDLVAATTTTDAHGNYALCGLPTWQTFVTPVLASYRMTQRPVTIDGVARMDLEMERQ